MFDFSLIESTLT